MWATYGPSSTSGLNTPRPQPLPRPHSEAMLPRKSPMLPYGPALQPDDYSSASNSSIWSIEAIPSDNNRDLLDVNSEEISAEPSSAYPSAEGYPSRLSCSLQLEDTKEESGETAAGPLGPSLCLSFLPPL
ncbi:hypothetical protein QAD02_008673 [Eretmocerus hayati]|uniref:Uncharacterized protein n=1 Tax=Eretmocerus hayati TaxID=131215 RepID=A0ACC2N7F5_9HYME|nr:hypothetical protein QAD02_008673 [Eretmocerus hayati]